MSFTPSPELPTSQIGVLTSKGLNKVQTFPVPRPGPSEVLIRNVAVASNPKDWKVVSVRTDYAFIEGNDVAGRIVQVGENVRDLKAGDDVAALTKAETGENKYGAYAQFSVAPTSTTFRIPENTTFEEAATLPLAVMTAAIALFVRLGLPEPPFFAESTSHTMVNNGDEQRAVVIYGASSSVGTYAVQLARRAGLYVVGIAGASCEYVKSLGANFVIDYRKYGSDEEMDQAISNALSSHVCAHAFDAVCVPGSTLALARAVARNSPEGEGKVTYVLELADEDKQRLPLDVKAVRTLVSTAHGSDEEFAARFYCQISSYLAPTPENPIPLKPNRVKLMPDGLASVGRGLAMLRAGDVHAEKLVYRVADTPHVRV